MDHPDADASQPTADEDHPEMDEAPSDGSTDEQGAGLVDEQSVITEEQSASDDLNDQPAEPESNAEDQAGDQLAPLPVDIGGQTPVPKLCGVEGLEKAARIVLYFLQTGKLSPETKWAVNMEGDLPWLFW